MGFLTWLITIWFLTIHRPTKLSWTTSRRCSVAISLGSRDWKESNLYKENRWLKRLRFRWKNLKRFHGFLGNFNFKTTQMMRDINFKVFKKLLVKSRLKSITIDIDNSVVNVEGHQEGAVKGLNNANLFFYLTNSVKSHENTVTHLVKSDGISVFVWFSANNLLTLYVYVNRKKKQPKVSPGLGENGVKLLLTWSFDFK